MRRPASPSPSSAHASAKLELSKTINDGLSRAERLSLPITFLVLLIAFGAFVAAGLPVLLAFSAVLGSGGLAAVASHLVHASEATSSVMLLMGMAVGVDYSLFYLKREREERRAGHTGADVAERAAATSGRAVLASGITVLIAMAGMLLSGTKVFDSIGIGAMLVVFMRDGRLAHGPARAARQARRQGRQGPSAQAAHDLAALGRAAASGAALSGAGGDPVRRAAGGPGAAVVGLHTTLIGPGDLPRSIPIVRTYEKIQKAFPGAQSPAVVAFKAADVRTPQAQAAIAKLKRLALASGQAREPIQTTVNAAHTVAQIQVPLVGSGQNRVSMSGAWHAAFAAAAREHRPAARRDVCGHRRNRRDG